MRILLITETIPYPLDSGGRIKTWHTLGMLSRQHQVHCHAFIRSDAERRWLPRVQEACASVSLDRVPRSAVREGLYLARSLASGRPYTVLRHVEPGSAAALRRLAAGGFDLVYADHLSMMEYARQLELPVVYDAHNVEFEILRRYAATRRWSPARLLLTREWRRVRVYERWACRAATLVVAVSEADADALRSLAGPACRVRVVPISVDARSLRPVGLLTREPRLLFVGGLHWPPNLDAIAHFAREVWPRVRAEVPAATLTVVGRDDVPDAESLRRTPGLTLAGHVPEVESWFGRSRVMVVPLRAGSGMRVKILDAFARGVPVVSTPIGHEGIDVEPGRHLLSASDPGDLARAVIDVLRDDRLAGRLAAAARRLVEERYDVGVVARLLAETIDTVEADFGSRRRREG